MLGHASVGWSWSVAMTPIWWLTPGCRFLSKETFEVNILFKVRFVCTKVGLSESVVVSLWSLLLTLFVFLRQLTVRAQSEGL